MGNLKQNAAGKAEFKSKMLDIFKAHPNENLTRQQLCEMSGYCDSIMRREVSKVARFYPVISLSKNQGYAFIEWNSLNSKDELEKVRQLIWEQMLETQNRVDALKKRLKPLIANLKVLDRIIGEKERSK